MPLVVRDSCKNGEIKADFHPPFCGALIYETKIKAAAFTSSAIYTFSRRL